MEAGDLGKVMSFVAVGLRCCSSKITGLGIIIFVFTSVE